MQAWKDENVSRGGFHQNISYPRKNTHKRKEILKFYTLTQFSKEKKKKLISYIYNKTKY